MSIFQVKEWWSTTVGDNEEFDHNNIILANVDNDPSQEDKIVVGSFEGKLRVFRPNSKKNNQYHVDDMIIEKNMGFPILQVGVGRFTKHYKGNTLAILSTRELTIHSIETKSNFSTINCLQSHKLDRNAFNFIHGSFGKQTSNDQIIVQSVDGALIVIDDEFIVFKISLADYFIPGPISYS